MPERWISPLWDAVSVFVWVLAPWDAAYRCGWCSLRCMICRLVVWRLGLRSLVAFWRGSGMWWIGLGKWFGGLWRWCRCALEGRCSLSLMWGLWCLKTWWSCGRKQVGQLGCLDERLPEFLDDLDVHILIETKATIIKHVVARLHMAENDNIGVSSKTKLPSVNHYEFSSGKATAASHQGGWFANVVPSALMPFWMLTKI